MTVFHVFYIPVVFLLGIAIGVVTGRQNLTREIAMRERAEREREARRAVRRESRP